MESCTIIVTRPKGSWKWQNAYALSTYVRESADKPWRFHSRGPKFAKTRYTEHYWERYGVGRESLPK